MIVNVTSKMVKALGYKSISANDRNEIFEILRDESRKIDHAIIDFRMPGVDVVDMVNKIKKLYPNLNVIVSSGYDYQKGDSLFSNIVFDRFLKKPYTLSDLKETLGYHSENP